MKRILLAIPLLLLSASSVFAQLPCNVMVGYWQNSWGTAVRIKDINANYNVICLAFLEADKNLVSTDNTITDLEFTPTNVAQVKADIPIVQGQGRKVLISIVVSGSAVEYSIPISKKGSEKRGSIIGL